MIPGANDGYKQHIGARPSLSLFFRESSVRDFTNCSIRPFFQHLIERVAIRTRLAAGARRPIREGGDALFSSSPPPSLSTPVPRCRRGRRFFRLAQRTPFIVEAPGDVGAGGRGKSRSSIFASC